MKTINMVLMSLMVMALTACGGGGGGGGGGNPGPAAPTGSAQFANVVSGSGGSQCVKNNTIVGNFAEALNTQTSCQNAGGTWASTSYTSDDMCRLGGRDFKLRSGNASATGFEVTSCVDAGGSVIAGSSQTMNYCNISSPTCSDVGGTTVSTRTLSGDMVSANIIAGGNVISADAQEVKTAIETDFGFSIGSLDNITVQPVAITATATISDDWDYDLSMTYSVSNFQDSSVQLNATSPMAISGALSVKTGSVIIFYHQ